MTERQRRVERLDTDETAWKLAGHLLEDFKPFVPSAFYDAAYPVITGRNVEGLRALACGTDSYQSPYQMKATRQLLELFKKFSFSRDLHTPEQLREDAIKKFLANQERLLKFRIPTENPLIREILFGARGYVDKILGDFSHLEICERATFGKKSSVGIPMRLACEGERYEAPITGSDDHIDWFSKYYRSWNRPAYNYAEARAVLSQKPLFRSVDVLEAVLVDKTWKSLRMIMPNTTLGTLYSGGLGRVIEDRLRHAGQDIKHLQEVHGELARVGSITGSLVTADQSMASDNITVQLIEAIFPFRWANALKFGRIGKLRLYGREIDTPTFSTMGIGFTFPLQTLVFLAVLFAIRDYCGLDEATVISVFGDDLVYDKEMHPFVMDIFPKLGLVINADKTFADGFFRESCGRDYYHGVDVRPFLLGRAPHQNAGKRRQEAYLYTILNGLLRRWEVYEIPLTSDFLLGEIRRIRGSEPLQVPPDYPDTSGVKVSREDAYHLQIQVKVKRGSDGLFHFRYLAFEPDLKLEGRHYPYLYRHLQMKEGRIGSFVPFNPFRVDTTFFGKWSRGHGDITILDTQVFSWEPDSGRTVRSELTGQRHRPLAAHISQQDAGRFRERPGVLGDWTSVRY